MALGCQLADHDALPDWRLSNLVLLGLLRWAQVFLQGNIEVKQFGAFGIVDAGYVDVRARERRGDVSHIEEEESGLRGVGLDGFGGELRGFDLVHLLLADRALYLLLRGGKLARALR